MREIQLEGIEAGVMLAFLLICMGLMYLVLRYFESRNDRFGLLLKENKDNSPSNIPSNGWKTEYTNPIIFEKAQFGVRFETNESLNGWFLRKTRSVTGATDLGVVFLPNEKYSVQRHIGCLKIDRR
jgi:hypothetical protein